MHSFRWLIDTELNGICEEGHGQKKNATKRLVMVPEPKRSATGSGNAPNSETF